MTTETSISSISGGNLNPISKSSAASVTNHVNKKLLSSDKIENLQVFENCPDPISGSVLEKVKPNLFLMNIESVLKLCL